MPRNPITEAAQSYIESQKQKGKAPGPSFFQFVPGAKTALSNLTKQDQERAGIRSSTSGTPNTAPSKTIGGILVDRKKQIDAMSAAPNSYKKGGMVKKTGLAKVHRGEKVLTKSQAKKMSK